MTTRRVAIVPLLLTAFLAMRVPDAAAQTVPNVGSEPKAATQAGTAVFFQVMGDVASPLSFTAEEFAKLPRQTVRAKGHDGVESNYDGVSLVELLSRAGVPTGKDLRGKAMALYAVVEAADDYRAVFALAELDQAFTDRVILLADRRDGQPLSAREAPFQVIVPGEKKHARWVRQVVRLRVGRA